MKDSFEVQTVYRGDAAKMREQVRALEVLEGYPLRPTFVGAGCAALVAADPTFGMTTKLTEVADDGSVELPPELVQKWDGRVAVVDGKQVVVDIGDVAVPVEPIGGDTKLPASAPTAPKG